MAISNTHYGTHQCWKVILKGNKQLRSKNKIAVGQKLFIPNEQKCTHPNKKIHTAKNNQKKVENLDTVELTQDVVEKIQKLAKQRRPRKLEPSKRLDPFSPAQNLKYSDDDYILYNNKSGKYRGLPQSKTPIRKKLKKIVFKEEITPPSKDNQIVKLYTIQLASFNVYEDAMVYCNNLKNKNIPCYIKQKFSVLKKNDIWFRVFVGNFGNRKLAKDYIAKLNLKKDFPDLIILKRKDEI